MDPQPEVLMATLTHPLVLSRAVSSRRAGSLQGRPLPVARCTLPRHDCLTHAYTAHSCFVDVIRSTRYDSNTTVLTCLRGHMISKSYNLVLSEPEDNRSGNVPQNPFLPPRARVRFVG